MNLESFPKLFLCFCIMLVASFGYSQSTVVIFKQEDFKLFSMQYTKFGLESFWKSMYTDYRFSTVASDSMPSGVINACL